MLMLNEAWEKAYREYLIEEEQNLKEDIDSTMAELAEINESSKKSLQLLSEFYNMYDSYSLALLEDDPPEQPRNDHSQEAPPGTTVRVERTINNGGEGEEKGSEKKDEKEKKDHLEVVNTLKNVVSFLNDKQSDFSSIKYNPSNIEVATKVGDMKFPQNILFFIKSIVVWIKNVVLYFIGKFINLFKRLIGMETKKVNPNLLKLQLEKVKKIEVDPDFERISDDKPVKVYKIKKGYEPTYLSEGLFDGIFIKDEPKKNDVRTNGNEKERIFVSIDLSRDLFSLRELVDHFYKLFDNAYGTNNEKLFESDDLKLILEIFKDTMNGVVKGTYGRYYSIGSSAVEVSPVNLSVIKGNHATTVQNLNSLKSAYISTASKIKDIAKIITSKEMMAVSEVGASFKMLSSATLNEMENILSTVPTRMKEAKKLEKKLTQMKKEYEALVSKLAGLQNVSVQVSNISYDTIYNKKLQELLTAARYMTDIVTLRLTALGLYIKQLADVRQVLITLANVSGRNDIF